MFEIGQRVNCKTAVWDNGTISPTPERYTHGVIKYVHPTGKWATVEMGERPWSYLESFMLGDIVPA